MRSAIVISAVLFALVLIQSVKGHHTTPYQPDTSLDNGSIYEARVNEWLVNQNTNAIQELEVRVAALEQQDVEGVKEETAQPVLETVSVPVSYGSTGTVYGSTGGAYYPLAYASTYTSSVRYGGSTGLSRARVYRGPLLNRSVATQRPVLFPRLRGFSRARSLSVGSGCTVDAYGNLICN